MDFDFLECRKQRVVLWESQSQSGLKFRVLLHLFILYINDLPDRVKNQAKLYADDSKILAAIKLKRRY